MPTEHARSISLPDHLDLDLPCGEMLVFSHEVLSPAALYAWRQQRYLLALEADPELAKRWTPVTEEFVWTDKPDDPITKLFQG
jgi:hypothetical protein